MEYEFTKKNMIAASRDFGVGWVYEWFKYGDDYASDGTGSYIPLITSGSSESCAGGRGELLQLFTIISDPSHMVGIDWTEYFGFPSVNKPLWTDPESGPPAPELCVGSVGMSHLYECDDYYYGHTYWFPRFDRTPICLVTIQSGSYILTDIDASGAFNIIPANSN